MFVLDIAMIVEVEHVCVVTLGTWQVWMSSICPFAKKETDNKKPSICSWFLEAKSLLRSFWKRCSSSCNTKSENLSFADLKGWKIAKLLRLNQPAGSTFATRRSSSITRGKSGCYGRLMCSWLSYSAEVCRFLFFSPWESIEEKSSVRWMFGP